MAGPHLSLLSKEPIAINQTCSITNPSRQLSVKQARLPLESKNTSVQICQLHKENPLLTSGPPTPQEYDDF